MALSDAACRAAKGLKASTNAPIMLASIFS